MNWQPIETAPNDASVLVAYDDGSMRLIEADENDYEWRAWNGNAVRGIMKPTHWMPLPPPPVSP